MNRLRAYRSPWACLAVVAVIGNIVASAFCCAPSPSRRAEIIDPVLGVIPLCTNALDGSGGNQPKGSKQHCPICPAAAHKAIGPGAFALSAATATVADTDSIRTTAPAIAKDLKLGGLGSRAPPLHA
jgi:hypothetical protein